MKNKFCSECGAPLDPGAVECKCCGYKIETNQAIYQEAAQQVQYIPVQKKLTNGLGNAGFILGLVGAVFNLIGCFFTTNVAIIISYLSVYPIILGIIFSSIGLRGSRRGKRKLAAIGLAVSLIVFVFVLNSTTIYATHSIR